MIIICPACKQCGLRFQPVVWMLCRTLGFCRPECLDTYAAEMAKDLPNA